MSANATIFVDGGFRPSSKLAACACVAMVDRGFAAQRAVRTLYLGRGHTNNTAEYEGLILGMRLALELEISDVQFASDSMLVVEQILGEWAIKVPRLEQYVSQARELAKSFDRIEIMHVPRHNNKDADKLVTEILDKRSGKRR